jgi:hypothetical protein
VIFSSFPRRPTLALSSTAGPANEGPMPKLTKEQSAEVEREALRLYDKLNPQSDVKINVSKQECIDRARRKLFPKTIN